MRTEFVAAKLCHGHNILVGCLERDVLSSGRVMNEHVLQNTLFTGGPADVGDESTICTEVRIVRKSDGFLFLQKLSDGIASLRC